MAPLFRAGDSIFVEAFKTATPRVGDVVVFPHPFEHRMLIKQVASISNDGVELRGMSAHSTDSHVFGLVNKKTIVGIVRAVI